MIALRKLTEQDMGLVRTWRNANAEYFGDTRQLEHDDQWNWWQGYKLSATDHMYVVMAGKIAVGTVGLLVPAREIQRVMLGDKEYARFGVMSRALTLLMQTYGPGDYHLYVKQDNDMAISFYSKNGFNRTLSVRPRPGMISMHKNFTYTEMIAS